MRYSYHGRIRQRIRARAKKDRPEGGASERPGQGLASENDRKDILPHFARKCKPRAVREEVNLL